MDEEDGEGYLSRKDQLLGQQPSETSMSADTYIGLNSFNAALCAAGIACRAVDISVGSTNTNIFVCTRPPGTYLCGLYTGIELAVYWPFTHFVRIIC